jgi:hypothetical protein
MTTTGEKYDWPSYQNSQYVKHVRPNQQQMWITSHHFQKVVTTVNGTCKAFAMHATAPRHGTRPLTGKKGENPCFLGKFASLVGGARVGGVGFQVF